MDTAMQLRNGDTINNPTDDQLRQALTQLDNKEETGYDLFLTANIDGDDWFITALPDGSATLNILGSDQGLFTFYDLPSVSRDEVLDLWHELQQGQADKIKSRPWHLHPHTTT